MKLVLPQSKAPLDFDNVAEQMPHDPVMQELWQIKDNRAASFKNGNDIQQHLLRRYAAQHLNEALK